jgi:hypothetical protein
MVMPHPALANGPLYATCTRTGVKFGRIGVYRNRTGIGRKSLSASRFNCCSYSFLLVAETHTDLLEIRPVSVRVRLGARDLS